MKFVVSVLVTIVLKLLACNSCAIITPFMH